MTGSKIHDHLRFPCVFLPRYVICSCLPVLYLLAFSAQKSNQLGNT